MLDVMHYTGLTNLLAVVAALLFFFGLAYLLRAWREIQREDYHARQTTEGRQPDEWEIAARYRASHGRQ